VEVDTESTEGIHDLPERGEGAALVEVGPEDARQALAGDAFARLEDEEEEGGEEVLGLGLDAYVVDLDHALAECSQSDHTDDDSGWRTLEMPRVPGAAVGRL
jgi:hypothetical protein